MRVHAFYGTLIIILGIPWMNYDRVMEICPLSVRLQEWFWNLERTPRERTRPNKTEKIKNTRKICYDPRRETTCSDTTLDHAVKIRIVDLFESDDVSGGVSRYFIFQIPTTQSTSRVQALFLADF